MRYVFGSLLIGAACAILSSCGAGGVGGGNSQGQLTDDVGILTADYVIVDLDTGQVDTAIALNDASIAAYRTNKMVFRAVPAGTTTTGSSSGSFGAQLPDEAQATAAHGKFYLAVFELTQAQWTRLVGSAPWTATGIASVAGASAGDAVPAYGLSREAVESALSAAVGRWTFTFDLPTDQQWEVACRAGSTTVFSWGDLGATPTTTANGFARVSETTQGSTGPEAVGARTPNALGFYDMHGNVWEWTKGGSGTLRGGSWRDSLAMARSANKQDLDRTVAHALVGVRLILVP